MPAIRRNEIPSSNSEVNIAEDELSVGPDTTVDQQSRVERHPRFSALQLVYNIM